MHPTVLAELSEAEQRWEYEDNFQALYEILGEDVETMSHPCNSYNNTTLSILREMVIRVGFRANMEKLELSGLEYPREDHANLMKVMEP